jgi:branched-chain amino acid transport system permease protein
MHLTDSYFRDVAWAGNYLMLDKPRPSHGALLDPILTNAVTYGCIYGIMCVGLTLTYMTTKVPNFAHSNFVVVALFTGATAFIFGGIVSPYESIPVAFLVGGISAILMYLLVLKPLIARGANIVVLMIATFAVSIVLDAFVAATFFTYIQDVYGRFLADKGYYLYSLNQLPDILPNGASDIFGVKPIFILAPVALVGVAVSIVALLRTRFGIAMRAAIENPNLAKILGINVDRVYMVSWFIAGALAGVGGSLYSIQAPAVTTTSSNIIVDIFAGVVLGGIGSIYGGIIGGFIVGFSETYVISVLTNFVDANFGYAAGSIVITFQKGVPLAIMIVALLVIPRGLTSVDWRKILKRFR